MASLLEIRKKIGSVKNMKKITKAMQLVATSKMKQFQEKAVASRAYVTKLLHILHAMPESEDEVVFTSERKKGKSLFILYSSDKGLCGSMNMHLWKGLMNADAWVQTNTNEKDLITIGKKASDMARLSGIATVAEWRNLPEKFFLTDIIDHVSHVIDMWHTEEYAHVYMIVPLYKNAFTFYPQCKEILPLRPSLLDMYKSSEDTDARASANHGYMLYEPDQSRVTTVLYTQLIIGLFAEALEQLRATEYSSRMMAMQNATDAAQKMIEQKTLIYNKIRQQMITQQISEIVNAAEAIL